MKGSTRTIQEIRKWSFVATVISVMFLAAATYNEVYDLEVFVVTAACSTAAFLGLLRLEHRSKKPKEVPTASVSDHCVRTIPFKYTPGSSLNKDEAAAFASIVTGWRNSPKHHSR